MVNVNRLPKCWGVYHQMITIWQVPPNFHKPWCLLNSGVDIIQQSHLPFWMEAGQIPNFSIAMSTYHRVIRSMWNDMNDDPHFPGTTKNTKKTHGTRFIDSFLPLLCQQLEVVPKKGNFINILTWLWKPLKPWPIFLDDLPSKTNCFFPYV